MKLPALLALLLLATTAFSQERPSTTVLSSATGRFVFGQISSMRADQYLLDTQTGRLWQMVADKEGKLSLQPVTYITTVGALWLEAPSAKAEHEEIAQKLKEYRASTNTAAEVTQKYFGTNAPVLKLEPLEPKKP